MSSKRKILWSAPAIGQLRCLKIDPSKTLFFGEYYWTEKYQPTKGRAPMFISIRKIPVDFLQVKIVKCSELWEEHMNRETRYGFVAVNTDYYRLALDYLFEELGRRAKVPVVP